jgi:hypothetical protein
MVTPFVLAFPLQFVCIIARIESHHSQQTVMGNSPVPVSFSEIGLLSREQLNSHEV